MKRFFWHLCRVNSKLLLRDNNLYSLSGGTRLYLERYLHSYGASSEFILLNWQNKLVSKSVCSAYFTMSSYPFYAEYDKRGAAKCKKCQQKLEKGMLRIGKIVSNPFTSSGGEMKQWHHVDCLFEAFKRARATTKKIDDPAEDVEKWEDLEEEDKERISALIKELEKNASPKTTPQKKMTPVKKEQKPELKRTPNKAPVADSSSETTISHEKDDTFKEFRRLCANIAEVSSYLSKTELVSRFFEKGTDGSQFNGDLRLWVKLLLPGVVKRVYNLQSKQLIKLFSQVFGTSHEEMLEHLEQGDVAETVRVFFEDSTILPPAKKSKLSIHEVDSFLDELTGLTREEDQGYTLKKIAQCCTGSDLKMVVRIIKGDLRINAGAKHILDGVHQDAYEAFQTTRSIDAVMNQVLKARSGGSSGSSLKISAEVMTPILPMLAEACRSVDQAMKKCPSGMYSEIKYDGERVQVHKKGNEFKYFSRSLKPVMPHKVMHFKDYLPKAFPHGKDLILDAEVLLIDATTGNPLPFGTLGVHKKSAFKDANVCLFIFDCIHYNGENLMDKPISLRKHILQDNMVEIKNHVMFSEMKVIKKASELESMIKKVLSQGLEGLVLKDINSIYEPGKRHWLKVKKDYLNDGAMADSADLVVLGAWYGTGKKGGMMSIFLMGCHDPQTDRWCTVTKVHSGHDDAALERLQTELDMVKITQDYDSLPLWLSCNRGMTPDFVSRDPKKSPVWEITGAEFTKNTMHTASGISVRFPRVTRVRNDKSWEDATDLARLQILYQKSKEVSDVLDPVSSAGKAGDDGNGSGSEWVSGFSDTEPSATGESGSPTSAKKRKAVQEKYGSPSKLKNSPQKEKKQTTLEKLFRDADEKSRTPTKATKDETRANSSQKRGLDESVAEHSSKKVCRYGTACKNTDQAHRSLFEHPSLAKKHPTINPLPDVFTGIRLCIPGTGENCDLLRKYFVAYDGDLLPQYRSGDCTYHIINTKLEALKMKKSGTIPSITEDWLWDSIKLQSPQPIKPYIIQ